MNIWLIGAVMKKNVCGTRFLMRQQLRRSDNIDTDGAGGISLDASLYSEQVGCELQADWLDGVPRTSNPYNERMSNALKLAWAAGFIDGDGCLCPVIQRHPNRATDSVRIRLVITQNDHHVLEVLKGVLGEQCALNGTKRQLCQNRHSYQLQYDSGHAIAAIKKIRPYLVRKAREADLCLQLFVEGQLNKNPGPRGFSPEVHRIRQSLVKRIRKMK